MPLSEGYKPVDEIRKIGKNLRLPQSLISEDMHYNSPFNNRTHPERRGNEELLSNMTLEDFNMCDLPSKRMGITAYTINGTRITYRTKSKQLFPVFVSKEDLEKAFK